MGVEERLAELGLELPPPPKPVASYVPVAVAGSLAYVAGQIPMVDGEVLRPGHVGADVTAAQAKEAARHAALQALSALGATLGGFERLRRIIKVEVFIASAAGFVEQPLVANGASDLFVEVLGEAGRHARAAVGVAELPLGACVEVTVVAEVV